MATIADPDCWFCLDCGLILANDDDSGCEDGPAHRIRMATHAEHRGTAGDFVISGCNAGEACDFAPAPCERCGEEPTDSCEAAPAYPDVPCVGYSPDQHVCRYDRDFSSVQCDACGTYDAGHRFAGVEFDVPVRVTAAP